MAHYWFYNGDKSKKWEFLAESADKMDGPAYCAKNLPATEKKADDGSGSVRRIRVAGCRRPYGVGPGFCNHETQGTCMKPPQCKCYTRADGEDEETYKVRCCYFPLHTKPHKRTMVVTTVTIIGFTCHQTGKVEPRALHVRRKRTRRLDGSGDQRCYCHISRA